MQLSVVRNLILKGCSNDISVSGFLVIDAVGLCQCYGYRGIPVHLLLGPVIGPSSAQGRIVDPSYREDPHEEAPHEENDDRNC
jgi:hypothetical protein